MAAINNKIEIPFTDGRVILFKRPIAQSKRQFWQVRIRRDNGTYLYKSTKTQSQEKAFKVAERIYHDLLFAERKDVKYIPEGQRKFKYFVDEFISKGFSDYRRAHIEGIFRRYLIEFFGSYEIEKIKQSTFNQYVEYRRRKWLHISDREAKARRINKEPSLAVIRAELQVLRQYLIWCANKGYAVYVHKFGIEKNMGLYDVRRRSKVIEDSHLNRIRFVLRKRALYPFEMASLDLGKSKFDVSLEEAHKAMLDRCSSSDATGYRLSIKGLEGDITAKPQHYWYRLMLYYFTQISYHSLVRPSHELAQLRWKNAVVRDVRVEGKMQKMAFLVIPRDKKGRSKEVLLTGSGTIALLRYRHFSKLFGYGDKEMFMFPDPRGQAHMKAASIGNSFSKVMEIERLRIDWTGRNVSMYSYCRTNAIANALRGGQRLVDVSTMAGVSIGVLDKFYKENIAVLNPERFFTRAKEQKAIGFTDETYEADYVYEAEDWS